MIALLLCLCLNSVATAHWQAASANMSLRDAVHNKQLILESVEGFGEVEPIARLKYTVASALTIDIETGTILRSPGTDFNSFVLVEARGLSLDVNSSEIEVRGYVLDTPGSSGSSLFDPTSGFIVEEQLAPEPLRATLAVIVSEKKTDLNNYPIAQAAVWKTLGANSPDYDRNKVEVDALLGRAGISLTALPQTVPVDATEILTPPSTTGTSATPTITTVQPSTTDNSVVTWILAALVIILLAGIIFVALRKRNEPHVVQRPLVQPQPQPHQPQPHQPQPHQPQPQPVRPTAPNPTPGHVSSSVWNKFGKLSEPSVEKQDLEHTDVIREEATTTPTSQSHHNTSYNPVHTHQQSAEGMQWQQQGGSQVGTEQPQAHVQSHTKPGQTQGGSLGQSSTAFTSGTDTDIVEDTVITTGGTSNGPSAGTTWNISGARPLAQQSSGLQSMAVDVPDVIENTDVLIVHAQQPTTTQESQWEGGKFYLEGIDGKWNGQELRITDRRSILTRYKLAEIVVENTSVSAPHALLDISRNGLVSVVDLHSSNGTQVNDIQVSPPDPDTEVPPTPLMSGDVLRLGEVELQYDGAAQTLTWINNLNSAREPTKWLLKGKNRWMITRRSLPFIEIGDDQAISSPHAYLDVTRGFELRPLKNVNPIIVDDGPSITSNIDVKPGSKIVLGGTTFVLRSAVDKLPDTIGPYRVLGYIAEGGMADIYRVEGPRLISEPAVDESLNGAMSGSFLPEPLALKVPKRKFIASSEFKKRWQREVEILRDLTTGDAPGTNLVRFVDAGQDEITGLRYLVMSFVDGCTLHKIRRYKGQSVPFDRGDAYDVIRKLSGALHYLHSHQIAHCDIKPGNLLFDHQGNLFLTDFGIASRFGESSPRLATRDYMAPEQAGDVGVTAKLDIYALGALFYLLLTGNKLRAGAPGYQQSSDLEQISSGNEEREQTSDIRAGTAAVALEKLADLPGEVHELLKRCLAPNPAHRLGDVQEILDILDKLPERGDLAALVRGATTIESSGE
jgi:serine/threonine protein kinase